MSCYVSSRHVMSCYAVSFYIVLCHVTSCRVSLVGGGTIYLAVSVSLYGIPVVLHPLGLELALVSPAKPGWS